MYPPPYLLPLTDKNQELSSSFILKFVIKELSICDIILDVKKQQVHVLTENIVKYYSILWCILFIFVCY